MAHVGVVENHILLVNSWIHDFSAYDLWMKPLGLLYLGSFLQQAGYQVSLIDCLDRFHPSIQTLPLPRQPKGKEFGCGALPCQVIPKPPIFKDIPRRYKRYGITPESFHHALSVISSTKPPRLIAVTSMMTYWYPGVFETINHLKQACPGVPIVLGGVYATLCHQHAQQYSGADYVIKGRGELSLLKLADEITGRHRDYQALKTDLDHLPFPAYHLYLSKRRHTSALSDEADNPEHPLPYICMLTSLGCPWRCDYCATPILAPGFYQRPPPKIVDEIKYYLHEFNITDIAFYDDALLVNAENHLEIILDLIIKHRLNEKLRFHTPNGLHLSLVTKPLAQKMYQAGFKRLRLGFVPLARRIEDHTATTDNRNTSPNYQISPRLIKSAQTELQKTIDHLTEAGYANREVRVYILMGLPDQTLEEIDETIELVHRCGGRISLAQYAPIPSTADFQKMTRQTGFDPAEPLWHNKSIYPARTEKISFWDYERLKVKAKRLNTRLDHGHYQIRNT